MNLFALFDLGIMIPLLGLIGISLSLIASTTESLFSNQLSYFISGFFLYFLFSSIDYRIWKKFSLFFYLGSLVFLLSSFLGSAVRGSSRWVDIGLLHLQPSEIIKPFLTITLAGAFGDKDYHFLTFARRILLFLLIGIIIFRQPDLGNVIVYFFTFMVMEFSAGLPGWYMFGGTVLFGMVLPFSWFILKEYQKARILSFFYPEKDPSGAGYNALQAVIAIGSGQLFGLGLGKGTQSHLLFLPEYHTDFVFASLGEELGFLGGFLVLFFYLILLGRLLFLAYNVHDRFGRLIIIGVFAQLFIQVFINIGMNVGILPITGITLPFVSFGGSSIISSFISLGMAVSVVSQERKTSPIVIK